MSLESGQIEKGSVAVGTFHPSLLLLLLLDVDNVITAQLGLVFLDSLALLLLRLCRGLRTGLTVLEVLGWLLALSLSLLHLTNEMHVDVILELLHGGLFEAAEDTAEVLVDVF